MSQLPPGTPPPGQQAPQAPAPGTISPDGQWAYNGSQWVPVGGGTTAAAVKQKHTMRNLGIGCLGLIVLVVIIGVAASSGNKNSSPAAPDKSSSQASAAPAAAAKVLLDVTGSGTKKTQKFTAAGDWDLDWSYDCSSFAGGSGNFQVYSYSDSGVPDVLTNELGKSGSDVTHQHTGGTYYLEMNSECNWHVVVKG